MSALDPQSLPARGSRWLRVFPARRKADPPPVRLRDVAENEAACFYQEGKGADHACAYSGRFMSELHTVHAGEKTYAFDVLSEFRKDRVPGPFHDRVIRFDRIGYYVALLPFLIPLYGILALPLTIPGAITLAIIASKKRSTVYGNTRGFIIATWVIVGLQVLGVIGVILAIIANS